MIKDLYLASEWAKEKRDLSEERYFTLLINEGLDDERTIEIDFQQTVNVSAYVKTHGGDLEAVQKMGRHPHRHHAECQRLAFFPRGGEHL